MLLTLTFASLFTIGDSSTVDPALRRTQVSQPPHGYQLERETRVERGAILRFRRIFEGLKVLDHEVIRRFSEDRGLVYEKEVTPLNRLRGIAPFAVTRDEAISIALERGPEFPHFDPLQPGNWSAQQAWRVVSNGLAPTWVIHISSPLPYELLEFRIDAVNGVILDRRNLVKKAQAHVFERSPGVDRNLTEVEIVDLEPEPAGRVLQSEEFQIRACCIEEDCEAGRGPVQITLPFGQFNVTMPFCDERPEARPDENGDFLYNARVTNWMPTQPGLMTRMLPADVTLADAPHRDSFAETQGYYHAHLFLEFLRRHGLEEFSLSDGGSGFAITVNFMVPSIPMGGQEGFQALSAAGCINMLAQEVSCFMPMDNAVFIPAIGESSEQTPFPMERDFDSVLMFHGTVGPFVYDADVLYHELTHATISRTSQLAGAHQDRWGTHLTPGSLHEGFADYMSMVIVDDPRMGRFVGGAEGIRDHSEPKRCPEDLIGEVHHDGIPLASQLWSFRRELSEDQQKLFDTAVVLGMAAIPTRAAGYTDAIEAIAVELELQLNAQQAEAFLTHMTNAGLVDCERVMDLLKVVEHEGQRPELVSQGPEEVFLAGAQQVGVREGQHAPTFFQGRIMMPPGTVSVQLRFAMEGSGGFMGEEQDAPELTAVLRDGAPIDFQFDDGRVTFNDDARLYPIVMQGQDAVLDVGGLDTACGGPLYVSLGTKTGGGRLSDFNVSVEWDDDLARQCEPEPDEELPSTPEGAVTPQGCGCAETDSSGLLGILLLLVGLRARKLLFA